MLMKCTNLWISTSWWKNLQNLKQLMFDQTYMEFDGCHGNVKTDGEFTYLIIKNKWRDGYWKFQHLKIFPKKNIFWWLSGWLKNALPYWFCTPSSEFQVPFCCIGWRICFHQEPIARHIFLGVFFVVFPMWCSTDQQ